LRWAQSTGAGAGRLWGEGGQVIGLTALVLTALLGAAALAIDVGSLDAAKQRLQGVAEVAAIAGARDLPGSPTTARSDAGNLVTTNLTGSGLSGVTVSYQTPFNGDSSQIEVTVSANSPSIFAGIFGISSSTVSAKAAAKHTQAGASEPGALFASDTACKSPGALYIQTNSVTINQRSGAGAAVHSNGSLFVQVNRGTFGETSYGGPNNCSANTHGNDSLTFDGASDPTRDPLDEPLPLVFDEATICSQPGAHSVTTPLTLASGVTGIWCSTQSITSSGDAFDSGKAGVTLVAPKVFIATKETTLTPYYDGLLAYVTGRRRAFFVQANHASLTGVISVPNGTFFLSSNSSNTGFVEAKDIFIQTNDFFDLTGTGPPAGAQPSSISPTE
jgi:putative Flp pilus-assembly TadE/G-like protein